MSACAHCHQTPLRLWQITSSQYRVCRLQRSAGAWAAYRVSGKIYTAVHKYNVHFTLYRAVYMQNALLRVSRTAKAY